MQDIDRGGTAEPRPGRQLIASSATVSIYNGLGVVAGFLLDAVVAATFGVGAQTDAFFAAWRLPYLITVVLGMAASATLVPIFARQVEASNGETLSDFSSLILNAVVLGMGVLCVLGVVLSPWLVGGLFGGLPSESLALAASLSRVLFLTVLFTGAVEVVRSLLYAHQVFAVPTAINLVRSMLVIAVLLGGRIILPEAAADDWGGLHLLAWGYVIGVMGQLLILARETRQRTDLRWRPLLNLRDPRLRQTIRLSAAPTAGALVRQSINLGETVIASYLPPGSVTILNYANRLTFVLSSVFLSSITTASMPVLSRDIGRERWQAVRQTLLSALRLVTFMALPLGIGLAFLGVPVIRLLLERGRFTAEASQLTGMVLSLYALSILFLGYFRVVQAYFYAALKAGVVLVLFVIMAVSTLALDLGLASRLGVQGIAIGFSVGTLLTTGVGLGVLARENLGKRAEATREPEAPPVKSMVRPLLLLAGKVAFASMLMSLAALGLLQILPNAPWALLPALAVGGSVFVAVAWVSGVRELRTIWGLIRRRLGKP